MKISCSSQSLDRQFTRKHMDLAGFIRYAAQTLKIGCVEIEDKHFANTTPHYVKAREHGLNPVIENHNHGGFLSHSKDVVKLFAEVSRNNLSLLLDTGNYVDDLQGIEKTVHLVRHHVHLKAGEITEDGRDASYDFDAILSILKKSGFDGNLSIEYEGSQDELACLPRIVTYLKTALT